MEGIEEEGFPPWGCWVEASGILLLGCDEVGLSITIRKKETGDGGNGEGWGIYNGNGIGTGDLDLKHGQRQMSIHDKHEGITNEFQG